jgi:SAM-dependent methyltransferase
MIVYAAAVFASAFLLFLVQPLLAKYILPWFGGSPGVWTTCLLFFQVLLTAGYAYAHFLAGRFSRRSQALITLAFLLLTLGTLPITPARIWVPDSISTPTLQIIKLLLASIGLCYFLLSSTGPLLQAWFTHRWPGTSPYRLYTLSNLGSLLAVFGYPFVVEPLLGLDFQTKLWSGLYAGFAVLCAICAIMLWKGRTGGRIEALNSAEAGAGEPAHPKCRDRLLWLILTALSSTTLMATTNQLCLDVAVIPLLWLLPMGLYLLSFVFCFHSPGWYSRLWYGIAFAAALIQTCVVLMRGIHIQLPLQIISYCFTLFVCCMICHGELVRRKPGPRHLTSFYLRISAGGAFGGVFVSLIAPRVFKAYWEYHLSLAGIALVFMVILLCNRHGQSCAGRPTWAWVALTIAYCGLIIALEAQIRDTLANTLVVKRNFFGVLKLLEDNKADPAERRMVLMHGRIEHGCQFTAEDKRYWPTSYFGPNSGVGIAIRMHPRRLDPGQRHLRVGVVGLGTGTIAAYGEQGDYFRFYELNPDVLEFSKKYFTYRQDSAASVEVVLGDARISMERAERGHNPGRFDVLAVDAFSSDAIPVHLLTRECYQHYWYHLKNDGILALHISSRYFNLSPVIRSLAQNDHARKPQAILVEDPGSSLQETDATRWILVTSNQEFLGNSDVKASVSPWAKEDSQRLLFTDDYSNLFSLLKK